MELVFEPLWSWGAVAVVAVALGAFVLATYPSRVRHLPTATRRTLIGLRLLLAALIVFAVLRPAIENRRTDRQSAVILVVGDPSRSMNTPDSPGGKTRREQMLDVVAGNAASFDRLRKDFDVRFLEFGEELVAVERFGPEAEANQSPHGAMMESLLHETQSGKIAFVLWMGDGAQRALPPLDADPRAMARRLGEVQVPVYPVPFGGSGVTGTSLDLAVENLLVDPLVFEKKIVPVTLQVRALGAAGREFEVRLLVEDRTGKRPGEAGELRPPAADSFSVPVVRLRTDKNADILPVELSFVPHRSGEFKLVVEAVPVDGELQQRNNRLETIITVQEGGINVAYFDRIRPEQKFLRLVNTSQNIQVVYQPVRESRPGNSTRIDDRLFAPGEFDAYILGDVPASAFSRTQMQSLAARIRDGAGLLMLGGFRTYDLGGYADTPLADLLPVALQPGVAAAGDRTALAQADALQHQQDLRMIPTGRGLDHFVMRLDAPERNRERWLALAPLHGANRLRTKPNSLAETLAETPEGIPLLIKQEVGAARILAFAGDTTYLWVLAGQKDAHQKFWRQMILYLAHKEQDTDLPVWVRVDPRNFAMEQTVPLDFGARDAKGQPIADAEFRVEVIDPDGESHALAPRRTADASTAEFAATSLPGDYWAKVTHLQEGRPIGLPAWTRFIVDARDLELDNPAADPGLMQEVAVLTGGSVTPPEELSTLLKRTIDEGPRNLDETQIHRTNLWDNWGFVLLFVGLLAAEWTLRKVRGLV